MGGVMCCQQKINFDAIESKEEIFIRETLENYSRQMVSNSKLNKLMQRYFSIILLDIEGNPLDWISEESYNEFIYKIFASSQKEIEFIKLEYNNTIKNLSIEDYYYNKFHLLLSMWLIGIAPSRTLNEEEKIKIIKNIILKCNKYVTYKTFAYFLNTFLEIMLIEVTYNFKRHNRHEVGILLNDVFNKSHVNEYCRWLCWKMGKIITKKKNKTLSSSKAINNEFIKDEDLLTFFRKYPFLLKPTELRKNFYNKYKLN